MGTPTLYRSTDASAPTLSGTSGDLIAVLDACLVNGYGAQSAAGWAKSFSGTNKAAYRPAAGTQFYCRVVDDGSDATQGARVATIEGYESMSDVDTGTAAFGSYFAAKSASADATTRPWFVLADTKRFVFGAAYNNGTNPESYNHIIFGDLIGHAAADVYPCLIFGSSTSTNAINASVGAATGRGVIAYTGTSTGITLAREVGGTGGAVAANVILPGGTFSGSTGYDDGPDASGRANVCPVTVLAGTSSSSHVPRGYVPGVYFVFHDLVSASNPAFTAYGDFRVIRYNGDSYCYALHVGQWD